MRVDTRPGFAAALESARFDLILADYNLPSFDGQAAQVMAADATPGHAVHLSCPAASARSSPSIG